VTVPLPVLAHSFTKRHLLGAYQAEGFFLQQPILYRPKFYSYFSFQYCNKINLACMWQLLSIHVIERFQMTANIYSWELKGTETNVLFFVGPIGTAQGIRR
jgi:hypothetical protein